MKIAFDEKDFEFLTDLLDVQQDHCVRLGATAYSDLKKPTEGNASQNSFYYGHLNAAELVALEFGFRIEKDEFCNHHFVKREI